MPLPLLRSGTVPMYAYHSGSANVHLYGYFLVEQRQSVPLYPSGIVPMYAYHSGTVSKYTSMAIFLLHCANTYLYFPVALCQYLFIHLFSSGTVPMHALNVCILIVLKV